MQNLYKILFVLGVALSGLSAKVAKAEFTMPSYGSGYGSSSSQIHYPGSGLGSSSVVYRPVTVVGIKVTVGGYPSYPYYPSGGGCYTGYCGGGYATPYYGGAGYGAHGGAGYGYGGGGGYGYGYGGGGGYGYGYGYRRPAFGGCGHRGRCGHRRRGHFRFAFSGFGFGFGFGW